MNYTRKTLIYSIEKIHMDSNHPTKGKAILEWTKVLAENNINWNDLYKRDIWYSNNDKVWKLSALLTK